MIVNFGESKKFWRTSLAKNLDKLVFIFGGEIPCRCPCLQVSPWPW